MTILYWNDILSDWCVKLSHYIIDIKNNSLASALFANILMGRSTYANQERKENDILVKIGLFFPFLPKVPFLIEG